MITGIESRWTSTDFEHLEMIPKGDSAITAFPVPATKDGRITCLRHIFEGEAARVTNLSIVSDFASIFRSSFEFESFTNLSRSHGPSRLGDGREMECALDGAYAVDEESQESAGDPRGVGVIRNRGC
jgi:hypothetical protein